jgi:hypothetical protein
MFQKIHQHGAYLLNGQTITKEAYPDFYVYIKNNQDNIRVITDEEYNNEIKQYVICNAFVISEKDIRLPTWNGYQTPLGDSVPVIGNGMTLGLTNGTSDAGIIVASNGIMQTSMNAYGTSLPSNISGGSSIVYGNVGVTSDPTKSGIVADTSSYAKDGFYWCIQVFNAATELSEQESAQLASQMQMKAQTDLANVEKVPQTTVDNIMPDAMDYIIESYLDDDGYWYRLYKSGWLEQGGVKRSSPITLLKSFKDTNYTVLAQRGYNHQAYSCCCCYNKTTTTFDIREENSATAVSWYVCGQSAKTPSVNGETISWSAEDNIKSFTAPAKGKMTATLWISSASTYYVKIMKNNTEVIFQHGPNGSFESGTHYEYPTFNVETGDIISLTVYGSSAGGYLTSYTPIISEE